MRGRRRGVTGILRSHAEIPQEGGISHWNGHMKHKREAQLGRREKYRQALSSLTIIVQSIPDAYERANNSIIPPSMPKPRAQTTFTSRAGDFKGPITWHDSLRFTTNSISTYYRPITMSTKARIRTRWQCQLIIHAVRGDQIHPDTPEDY